MGAKVFHFQRYFKLSNHLRPSCLHCKPIPSLIVLWILYKYFDSHNDLLELPLHFQHSSRNFFPCSKGNRWLMFENTSSPLVLTTFQFANHNTSIFFVSTPHKQFHRHNIDKYLSKFVIIKPAICITRYLFQYYSSQSCMLPWSTAIFWYHHPNSVYTL